MPSLFDPLKAGALSLPNRIIMAPLTRSRATPDTRVPTDLQVEYYTQRASAGLIISEATSVTPRGSCDAIRASSCTMACAGRWDSSGQA